MSHGREQGVSNFMLLQAVGNIFICKKVMPYFNSYDKGKGVNYKTLLKFIAFAIVLLITNQQLFFLISPTNLYKEAGVTRRMSIGEVKSVIESRKIQIMMQQKDSMELRMARIKRLEQISMILTHNARRLTYDSFGQTQPEYAWAFLSSNFLTSSIISNSIYFLMCLVVNMLNRDKRQNESALKYQLTYIITCLIIEVQLLMHTAERFNHSVDFLDYIYPAFPIFERRHILKATVMPTTILIENFYITFITSDSEALLNRLIKWVRPDMFLDIKTKLINIDTSPKNMHIEEQVDVKLSAETQNTNEQDKKDRISIFRLMRKIIKDFVRLQRANLTMDARMERLRQEYMLPPRIPQ